MRPVSRGRQSLGLAPACLLASLLLAGCDLPTAALKGSGQGPSNKPAEKPLCKNKSKCPKKPSARQALDRKLDAAIKFYKITPVPTPPEIRDELVTLGQLLNFDPILSGNQDIACASCHHPQLATADARHLPLGTGGVGLGQLREGGDMAPRNSPALYNLHAYGSMFWDNRVEIVDGELRTPDDENIDADMRKTFEFGMVAAQAMFPVTSHVEMRGQHESNPVADAPDNGKVWQLLIDRVLAVPGYQELFALAYPEENRFSFAHVANAIAAYEIEAFSFFNSPWQRYLQGDKSALSMREAQGALAFFDAGCANCHNGPLLSDFQLHNTAMAQLGPGKGQGESGQEDWGRMRITDDPADRFLFRTAPLINVSLTAPYGHAGQFATLRDHVEHYKNPTNALQSYDPKLHIHESESHLWSMLAPNQSSIAENIDPQILALRPFETSYIVDFLYALTDPEAADLEHELPDSVPSALAVDRMGAQAGSPDCDKDKPK